MLLDFQLLPELGGIGDRLQAGGRWRHGPLLLQTFHPLLNQHLGHVADSAGFELRQGRQALTQLFGQHHLNAGRLGAATGGSLAGGHGQQVLMRYSEVYRDAQG